MAQFDVALVNHGVFHGSLNLRVTKQALHLFHGHTFVDGPGGQGTPELMGMHPANFQLPSKLSDTDFHSTDFQTLMWILQRHKQCRVVIGTALQVILQVDLRSSIEVYRPFLASFSKDDALTSLKVNICPVQPHQFADADAG